MTETPNIWEIGADIPFELFLVNPIDSFGLTDQEAYVTLSIRRNSDGWYWNGVDSWVVGFSPLSVTQPDSTNQPGRYTYVLPGSTGNTQADIYIFRAKFNNPTIPEASGENYEQHKSRTTDVRVYESEPA